MKRISFLILLLSALTAAQVQVLISPVPKLQFFQQNGVTPLANGCVFTYQAGTSTPLDSYTDYTGSTKNSNPVVLSGGGFGSIWLQAGVSYKFAVYSFGGTNCALGTLQYTVDGISGGTGTATTAVTYSANPGFNVISQNQLFTITLTGNAASLPLTAAGIESPAHVIFQITEDGIGSHTFLWPANLIGGCNINIAPNQVTTQEFVWNSGLAYAIGPCVIGSGPSLSTGSITASSVITTSSGYQYQGAAPSNHVLVGNGTSYVDAASVPLAAIPSGVPKVLCASGDGPTVNASTAGNQAITSCNISPTGYLVAGKAFQMNSRVLITPGNNTTSQFFIGMGSTSAISDSTVAWASATLSVNPYFINTSVTCVVAAANQVPCSVVISSSTAAATVTLLSGTIDYGPTTTGNLFIGVACQFGNASVLNICTSESFVFQLLN